MRCQEWETSIGLDRTYSSRSPAVLSFISLICCPTAATERSQPKCLSLTVGQRGSSTPSLVLPVISQRKVTLQKKRFLNAGNAGRNDKTQPFSKTRWPRLVKQHQRFVITTSGWQRGHGKHNSSLGADMVGRYMELELWGCKYTVRRSRGGGGLLIQYKMSSLKKPPNLHRHSLKDNKDQIRLVLNHHCDSDNYHTYNWDLPRIDLASYLPIRSLLSESLIGLADKFIKGRPAKLNSIYKACTLAPRTKRYFPLLYVFRYSTCCHQQVQSG